MYQGSDITAASATPLNGRILESAERPPLNGAYTTQTATGSRPTGPFVRMPRPTHIQPMNAHAGEPRRDARTNPYSSATTKNTTGMSVRPRRSNTTNRNIAASHNAANN